MIKVQASPNIAFIKYWGKRHSANDYDRNIGLNPSLSMTLNAAKTTVQVERVEHATEHEIWIGGSPARAADEQKIIAHIERINAHFAEPHPGGAGYLRILSENNFPASAGIASSASAFCALTIAITAAIIGKAKTLQMMRFDLETLSQLARRGSGSAARSVAGGFLRWDDTHALPMQIDWPLRDTIVILSTAAKDISSSEGHTRALTSPYYSQRQLDLPDRMRAITSAMQARDLGALGEILETEALEMHRIAETSHPPIHYLNDDSRRLIAAIRDLPERNFYFTIDAGPNLHLISEFPVAETLRALLGELQLEAEIWEDGLGTGPSLE